MNQRVTPEIQPPSLWHAEAEQAVLGCVFLACSNHDPLPLLEIRERLKPSDFWLAEHGELFRALMQMEDAGQAIDPFTLAQHFEAQGVSQERRQALEFNALECMRSACQSSSLAAYAEVVRTDSTRRHLLALAEQLHRLGQDATQTPASLISAATEQLLKIQADNHNGMKTGRQLAEDFNRDLQKRIAGDFNPMGLPTGLSDFDQMTLGLHPGQLVILAARPAMGKTALVMNWVAHAMPTRPVLFASLEMSEQQLRERFISMLAQVDGRKLKDPNGTLSPNASALEDHEFDRVALAMQQMGDSKLELLDAAALSVSQLRAKALRIHAKHKEQGGLALVVVDYLQLMTSDTSKRAENRTLEVSEQTRALKIMARELGCPVVVLSQLSREVEKRANKRPMLADLRESGSIEQDADVVAFIYRDEVYNPDTHLKGVAEIIIGKQREGETGTIHTRAQLSRSRFSDLTAQEVAAMQAAAPKPSGFRA
ncbi:replicative DNA helicase [Marinospirillum sp. MEB164]|uniref:Replicative DNA helicase n=1 Tax=Marinospirillum alkalitolerans TaxID=3123374 RepID=A0ABW8PVC9_9GAMM